MRLLSLLFVLILVSPVSAQKKEISQARSYIKSRKSLDKAEALMRDLLKDSANRRNMKIHETLAEAVRAQYDAANEKMYLKETFDTVSFFNTARNMFLVYESLDSVDAMPDKKGRVKINLRKKNSAYLDRYRNNLYNGGLFFIRKKDYGQAYSLMDTYLDCARQPLFSDFKYGKDDFMSSSAAYWTVVSAYSLNRPDSALRYSALALENKRYRRKAFQYLAEIYLQKKDTLSYVKTLRKGFGENKKSRFFFTRLMDYYNGINRLDSAMSLADTALAADSTNTLFLFAKSNLLLNMGRYSDCIGISDALIARNDTLAGVYYNAGVSYINMALLLEKNAASKKKNRKKILEYYRKSLPYMEKYRQMMPDAKEKWAPSLYNIYLKLNMGRQFEEISGVIRKMRR